MTQEKKFIKEKAVAVVVEMAIRDWPQQWPNFLDLLVQIAAMGVSVECLLAPFDVSPCFLGDTIRTHPYHTAHAVGGDTGLQYQH